MKCNKDADSLQYLRLLLAILLLESQPVLTGHTADGTRFNQRVAIVDLRNEIACAENVRIEIKLWANVMCRFGGILVQPQRLKAELGIVIYQNKPGCKYRTAERVAKIGTNYTQSFVGQSLCNFLETKPVNQIYTPKLPITQTGDLQNTNRRVQCIMYGLSPSSSELVYHC